MTVGIYEIENMLTHQKYVGKSAVEIEGRWKSHMKMPATLMEPTMELYHENPDKVKFRIIHEISNYNEFTDEELNFILSVGERKELIARGGWRNECTLNAQPVYIREVNPDILNKRKILPDFVDDGSLLEGIRIWYYFEIRNYKREISDLNDKLASCKRALESKIRVLESDKSSWESDKQMLESKIRVLESDKSLLKAKNSSLKAQNSILKQNKDVLKEGILSKIKRWFK